MSSGSGGKVGTMRPRATVEGRSQPRSHVASVVVVGLRRAHAVQIYDNPGLVDLSVLACL